MWQLVVIAVIVGAAVMSYNSLVRLRETSEAVWADINVQLKRRYNLIPNIVETMKGYASHERETLEGVVAARSGAIIGTLIGLVGAFGAVQLVKGLLYNVQPVDPVAFIGVLLLLIGVAALAVYLPARRAAAAEPMRALKAD